jgi:hypothetical protein
MRETFGNHCHARARARNVRSHVCGLQPTNYHIGRPANAMLGRLGIRPTQLVQIVGIPGSKNEVGGREKSLPCANAKRDWQ